MAHGHLVCGNCGNRLGRAERVPYGKVMRFPMGWTQDADGVWGLSAYAEKWASHADPLGRERRTKHRRPPQQMITTDGVIDVPPTPAAFPARARCPSCHAVSVIDGDALGLAPWRPPGEVIPLPESARSLLSLKVANAVWTPPLPPVTREPAAEKDPWQWLQQLREQLTDEHGQARALGEAPALPAWDAVSSELEAAVSGLETPTPHAINGLIARAQIQAHWPSLVQRLSERAAADGLAAVLSAHPEAWSVIHDRLLDLMAERTRRRVQPEPPADYVVEAADAGARPAGAAMGRRVLGRPYSFLGPPADSVPYPVARPLRRLIERERDAGDLDACPIHPPFDQVPHRMS